MTATRMLAVNELGIRVGEDHQRAKLTNLEVDRLLELHEEHGIGYKRLANIFAIGIRTARDICAYTKRAQHATDFVRGVALTIEQRRALYPEAMGPTTADCAGCRMTFPYRGTFPLAGYRWCNCCFDTAIEYAKKQKVAKKRKNVAQTCLF